MEGGGRQRRRRQKEDATARRPRRAFSSPPLREITDHGQRERHGKKERKKRRKNAGATWIKRTRARASVEVGVAGKGTGDRRGGGVEHRNKNKLLFEGLKGRAGVAVGRGDAYCVREKEEIEEEGK